MANRSGVIGHCLERPLPAVLYRFEGAELALRDFACDVGSLASGSVQPRLPGAQLCPQELHVEGPPRPLFIAEHVRQLCFTAITVNRHGAAERSADNALVVFESFGHEIKNRQGRVESS